MVPTSQGGLDDPLTDCLLQVARITWEHQSMGRQAPLACAHHRLHIALAPRQRNMTFNLIAVVVYVRNLVAVRTTTRKQRVQSTYVPQVYVPASIERASLYVRAKLYQCTCGGLLWAHSGIHSGPPREPSGPNNQALCQSVPAQPIHVW
jgi:hypothetical protein